ncbi:hypothetical protein TIFTF001_053085 [Ficus carica]|uniref:Uncharacterized protein n=1 Tax=Ficus carica TaxID=3494 RepID=A0AA88JGX7_FICCA|nr:hypothetical protein TIFTF001_053085 [Ficus carica]
MPATTPNRPTNPPQHADYRAIIGQHAQPPLSPSQHAGHRAPTRAVTGGEEEREREERECGGEEEREREERTNPTQHVGHRTVTGQHAQPPHPPSQHAGHHAPTRAVTGQHAQPPLHPPQHASHRATTRTVTDGEEKREREEKGVWG